MSPAAGGVTRRSAQGGGLLVPGSSLELEENLERGVRRAAALEERDGEVEVDVAVERENERASPS